MKNVREHWAWTGTARATNGCNQGAAVEVDAIGEQQLKQTQSGAAVETDAIGEQQPKHM